MSPFFTVDEEWVDLDYDYLDELQDVREKTSD